MPFARLLTLLMLTPHLVFAGNSLTTPELHLHPTPAAVGLEIKYTGDDNRNAQASFTWRRKGKDKWRNGVEMTFDRERRLIWASIWPLEQGTTIEVRVDFDDPDLKGIKPLEETTQVRKFLFEPLDAKRLFVSPSGSDADPGTKDKPFKTLAMAAKNCLPGTIVVLADGVYPEGDLFQRLRGTATKPIVFTAAPGATPILDSSLLIAAKPGSWRKEQGNLFSLAHDPGDRAPGYVTQDGKRMFHFPSLKDLSGSTLKISRGWFHDAKEKRLYVRMGSDKSPDEHQYRVARHDYGVYFSGSRHVILNALTLRNYGNVAVRFSEASTDCVVHRCTIYNVPGGAFLKGDTTCDNAIWYCDIHEYGLMDYPWQLLKNSDQGRQGIFSVAGRGNSFCYNHMNGWFDCICPESWKNPDKLALNRDCDVMFNELNDAGDDAIEADGGGVNMRIHGNRIRQCHSALSLAPIERGPVYVTRNDATFTNLMFKLNVGGCTSLGWTYCYHNSGYCLTNGVDGGTAISFPPGIPCTNKVFRNNALICNEYCVRAGREACFLDYNCYFHVPSKPPRKFQWGKTNYPTLAAFTKAQKQEVHGLYVDPDFMSAPDLGRLTIPDSVTGRISDMGLSKAPRPGDMRLQTGSPCIDRGVILRGINEDHQGRAPDIGAFEHGLPK